MNQDDLSTEVCGACRISPWTDEDSLCDRCRVNAGGNCSRCGEGIGNRLCWWCRVEDRAPGFVPLGPSFLADEPTIEPGPFRLELKADRTWSGIRFRFWLDYRNRRVVVTELCGAEWKVLAEY